MNYWIVEVKRKCGPLKDQWVPEFASKNYPNACLYLRWYHGEPGDYEARIICTTYRAEVPMIDPRAYRKKWEEEK